MKFSLKIETYDRRLGSDIAGVGNSLSSGTIVDVPGGGKIEYITTRGCKAPGIPEVLEFIVEASTTIELGLISAWLYDKVKSKPVEKIVVRRRVITEITEENIREVIEEEINFGE
ncbi:MAG: hypothetical protein OET90_01745 [Desulfuromonadales bacterium]|nr:hypothetical protein [Desulfuromonadales bacterium]